MVVLFEESLVKKHILCKISNLENSLPEVPEKIFVLPKNKLLEFSFDPVDGRFFVKARKIKSKDLENMWDPVKIVSPLSRDFGNGFRQILALGLSVFLIPTLGH